MVFNTKKIENPKNPWDADFCFLREWGVFFEKRREKREKKRREKREERREKREKKEERREKREKKREEPPPEVIYKNSRSTALCGPILMIWILTPLR